MLNYIKINLIIIYCMVSYKDIRRKQNERNRALQAEYPLVNKLIATEEVFWINPNIEKYETAIKDTPLNEENVKDAEEIKAFCTIYCESFS